MKPFKFIKNHRYIFKYPELTKELFDTMFGFCNLDNLHVENCRSAYLQENPEIDPDGHYTFPIGRIKIETEFTDNQGVDRVMWHAGSDLYEEDDKIHHMIFFDAVDRDLPGYTIDIIEVGDNDFYVNSIEVDSPFVWDYNIQ